MVLSALDLAAFTRCGKPGKKCCEAGQTCRVIEDMRHNGGFRGFACVTP